MKLGTFFESIAGAVEFGEVKDEFSGLERLSQNGLKSLDIESLLPDRYDVGEFVTYLNAFGIEVSNMYHFNDFQYKNTDLINQYKQDVKKRLYGCASLNCNFFMPVPMVTHKHKNSFERNECRKAIAEYINYIENESKQYGIKIVIENFSDTNCPFSTIEDIEYFLTSIPSLRYVLDTGNFWFGDADSVEACHKFCDKTVHIHLKDINPNPINGAIAVCGRAADSVAIGEGSIPIDDILKYMKAHGYNGAICSEIGGGNDTIDKIERSLKYLNEYNY